MNTLFCSTKKLHLHGESTAQPERYSEGAHYADASSTSVATVRTQVTCETGNRSLVTAVSSSAKASSSVLKS